MTIKIVIGGVPFENFVSAQVDRSIENLSGSFSLIVTESDIGQYPLKAGSPCVITINDFPVITGFIDSISPSTSSSSHDIEVKGRDLTCDIIDSTLLASDLELVPPITLSDIINKVQSALGLKLPVTIKADIDPYNSTDFVAAQEGQNAWDFIDKHARKKQVLVNTDGNGGIVCLRSDSAVDKGLLLFNTQTNLDSNIIESSSSFDLSERFGQYVCSSQGNLSTQEEITPNDDLVTVRGDVAYDYEIRQTRKMVIVAEQASSTSDASNRALWQANINKARSITYRACVDGFVHEYGSFKGQPYSFNELVKIIDDNENINATMLIKAVHFTLDNSGGQKTDFEIVDKDSYKLELKDPSLMDKKKNKVGSDLTAEINAVKKEQGKT